jgi:hypothetical protein
MRRSKCFIFILRQISKFINDNIKLAKLRAAFDERRTGIKKINAESKKSRSFVLRILLLLQSSIF